MTYQTHEKVLTLLLILSVLFTRALMAVGHAFYALTILYAIYMAIAFKNSIFLPKELKKLSTYYVIFLLFLIPSIFVSHRILLSSINFLDFYIYRYAAFLIIPIFIKNRTYLFSIILATFIALDAESLYALHQVIYQHEIRAYGFRHDIILMLGSLLLISGPIALFFSIKKNVPTYLRCVSIISIFLMTLGVIANFSRSILILFPIALLIASLFLLWENRIKYAITLLSIITISTLTVHIYPEIIPRLQSIFNTTTDGSNLGRIYVWKSAIAMIKDYPIFGVGLNDFSYLYYLHYRLPQETQFLSMPHNIFLTITSESGFCGLLGLLTFLSSFCYIYFKNIFKEKSSIDLLLVTNFFFFIILFGMIDFPLHLSEAMRWFWINAGTLLSLKYHTPEFSKN